MAPAKGNRKVPKKVSGNHYIDDDDYRRRRERNNEAVKKSRVKSKKRTLETLERVNKLKTENEMLEEKIKTLTKELDFLKELFFAHTGTAHLANLDSTQIEHLMRATAQDDHPPTTERRTRKSSADERKGHHRA